MVFATKRAVVIGTKLYQSVVNKLGPLIYTYFGFRINSSLVHRYLLVFFIVQIQRHGIVIGLV